MESIFFVGDPIVVMFVAPPIERPSMFDWFKGKLMFTPPLFGMGEVPLGRLPEPVTTDMEIGSRVFLTKEPPKEEVGYRFERGYFSSFYWQMINYISCKSLSVLQ